MTALAATGFLTIGASDLEYRMIGPAPDAAPTIVMLHEGLGSAGQWGDFPDQLQAATGAGVFGVFARRLWRFQPGRVAASARLHADRGARGAAEAARDHRLSPRAAGRPLRWRVDRGDLCRRLRGSPHRRAGADRAAFRGGGYFGGLDRGDQAAYETTDLRTRLARWHKDVDNAFDGWNGAWLDPKFRNWDISEYLAYIRVPVAILQGAGDQYGTIRQIEIAQEECYCPVDVTMVPGAGHSRIVKRRGDARCHRRICGSDLRVHEGLPVRARNACFVAMVLVAMAP